MKKIIYLREEKIPCEIKRIKRSQGIRIIVYKNGRVVATAPKYATFRMVAGFVSKNSDWIFKKIKSVRHDFFDPVLEKEKYHKNKKQAFVFVSKRLGFFSGVFNIKHGRVFVKNQKTRWGSCNSKGDLSFNYKIMFLKQELSDYVIAHELCHCCHLNHSSEFWKLVENMIPDYNKRRKELKNLVI